MYQLFLENQTAEHHLEESRHSYQQHGITKQARLRLLMPAVLSLVAALRQQTNRLVTTTKP
ncbi:hypothetical protein [Agarivorans sp. 1_MG-2023]|uniref:hypothetical protein n=1 Tax=Agarivorans sp. 1_MG-2023 TaxID=3062634 RepID=UPI0026E22A26|nr:hypothetical protein [Agarivorans sp. 1_MG-2023]MDO6762382.1 hypothetical protein [Agarivorans sp. 1_MG-2023]